MDIYEACLHEIALEGLDGITLPALWMRLDQREERISVQLSENLKNILWTFVSNHDFIECVQISKEREDPVIFNRFLGIDIAAGKHVAIAPDELDIFQDIYPVIPVALENIKGSCSEFDKRINVTEEIQKNSLSLEAAIQMFGRRRLVLVASQKLREQVLRGPGVSPQNIEDLSDIEYCLLERIGRSRWQGEIQAVLNTVVFKLLKTSHIHYVMKSLFAKGLVTKQGYSYFKPDKPTKVHQQVLIHLPHFKRDARSMSDIKVDVVCEILTQSEDQSIKCGDLKQIMRIEPNSFKKLVLKMTTAGLVKIVSTKNEKNVVDRKMKLIKTPTEKLDEEKYDDDDEEAESILAADQNQHSVVAELCLTLQGYRYIISMGENGCSQAEMLNMLRAYGSLEARHICRKIEKAKFVKMIMVDHGKQRSQKYIAKDFVISSSHTKQFLAEKKKMKEIMETSGAGVAEEILVVDSSVASTTADNLSNENVVDEGDLTSKEPTKNQTSVDDTFISVEDDSLVNGSESTEFASTSLSSGVNLDDTTNDIQDSTWHDKNWNGHQTTRKMKRTNVILSFIKEHKIVEGFVGLQKLLQSEEMEEGLKTKICKKTVKRMVKKLSDDGLLKLMPMPITTGDRTMIMEFIVALDCNTSRMKTAFETAQFRMFSEESKKIGEQADATSYQTISHPPSLLNDVNINETFIKTEEIKSTKQSPYGFQPKFVRMKLVHEYLWYLAYGHPLNNVASDMEMLDYDKVKEYSKERTWKRFLPPVPSHPDYGPGWVQVGDAAVLLPLIVLCQYHQYTYKIDGLQQYLDDSVRRNSLVHQLPVKLKALLLHKRKYLFSLIQIIETLTFMGLITMSQQKKKKNSCLHKEAEMVYLHKTASILDTRKSQKGYSEVTAGLDYERLYFRFKSFNDVEKYWMKLNDICIMTPLGVRLSESLEDDSSKRTYIQLKKFIADHVARQNSKPCDDGSIPGDQKGAGGLDSSLYSHLYRNWFRQTKVDRKNLRMCVSNSQPDVTKNVEMKVEIKSTGSASLENEDSTQNAIKKHPRRLPKLSKIVNLTGNKLRKDIPKSDDVQAHSTVKASKKRKKSSKPNCEKTSESDRKQRRLSTPYSNSPDTHCREEIAESVKGTSALDYEIVTENNVDRNHRVKGGRGGKRSVSQNKKDAVPVEKKRKKSSPKVKKPKSKRLLDVFDLQAQKNMTGIRSHFSATEDTLLLLCKIASTLIMRKAKVKGRRMSHCAVRGPILRNFLVKNCKEAFDKTSHACSRRIRFLIKRRNACICHNMTVAELLEDESFMNEMFEDINTENMIGDSEELHSLFYRIVGEVQKRFQFNTKLYEVIPDDVDELHRLYNIKIMVYKEKKMNTKVTSEMKSHDITCAVLENLMYATLTLNEDEFSQYQAHKIFETYSNHIIAKVWEKIKTSGNICKKPDHLSRQRHLPFTVPMYHLSVSYFAHFKTKLMMKVFSDSLSTFNELNFHQRTSFNNNATCGPVVLMNMLLLHDIADFNISFSKDIGKLGRKQSTLRSNLSNSYEQKNSKSVQKSSKNRRTKFNQSPDDATSSDCEELSSSIDYSERELPQRLSHNRLDNLSTEARGELSFPSSVVSIRILQWPSVAVVQEDCALLGCKSWSSVWNHKHHEDVNECLLSFQSRKLPRKSQIISVDDDHDDDILDEAKEVISQMPLLEGNLRRIITLVGKCGVIGLPLCEMRKKCLQDTSSDILEGCLDALLERNLLFIVGRDEERVVLRKYALKWCVTGALYKGDRQKLREHIRKELTGITKRHDGGAHLSLGKSSKFTSPDLIDLTGDEVNKNVAECCSVLDETEVTNVSTTNVDYIDTANEQSFEQNESVNDAAEDLNSRLTVKNNKNLQSEPSLTEPLKTVDSELPCLSDSSNYEKVTYICRPWHSVSGEVNYTIAKLMISGVFLHILWNPGVTLNALLVRFQSVMQPVALFELLKKLIKSKCVNRHEAVVNEPWKLFHLREKVAKGQSEEENEYFTPTNDGILRMAHLTKVLDELGKDREKLFTSHINGEDKESK